MPSPTHDAVVQPPLQSVTSSAAQPPPQSPPSLPYAAQLSTSSQMPSPTQLAVVQVCSQLTTSSASQLTLRQSCPS